MTIERWRPSTTLTTQEKVLLKRAGRVRKLFAFLRNCRQQLFDDEFQVELEGMYRNSGAGMPPVPPALMAMSLLLQAYTKTSDAEAVELTVVDLRWQMVLGRLGMTRPAFSQGALGDFRARLIRCDMDRRLLERTGEFARKTGAFDPKKLPKDLRVAIDSSPLVGAGRVEDSFNLLAHAARKVVEFAAQLLGWAFEDVARSAGVPLLLQSSVKKALDVEWSDPSAKQDALQRLSRQLDALETWVRSRLPEQSGEPPLKEAVGTLQQLRTQDLEPDPSGGGKGGKGKENGRVRIREGVAEDRRVSIEDPEMRHGRKSKSKRFNGYKRHVASDLDTGLVIACAITPANRPEEEATPALQSDIERYERMIAELHIDRGYIGSPLVEEVLYDGGEVLCKPWVAHNGDLYTKADFKLNMRDLTITCPAGEVERLRPGAVVEFDPEVCDHCPLRQKCTMAARGTGRTISIAEDEKLQQRLRKLTATPKGRARLRERVAIEHTLAHISQRQGNRARYRGVRKNVFDLRRTAVVNNLETIHRRLDERKVA
jgi:Transposase DDE domain/Transposase domain (DUF772)